MRVVQFQQTFQPGKRITDHNMNTQFRRQLHSAFQKRSKFLFNNPFLQTLR